MFSGPFDSAIYFDALLIHVNLTPALGGVSRMEPATPGSQHQADARQR